ESFEPIRNFGQRHGRCHEHASRSVVGASVDPRSEEQQCACGDPATAVVFGALVIVFLGRRSWLVGLLVALAWAVLVLFAVLRIYRDAGREYLRQAVALERRRWVSSSSEPPAQAS